MALQSASQMTKSELESTLATSKLKHLRGLVTVPPWEKSHPNFVALAKELKPKARAKPKREHEHLSGTLLSNVYPAFVLSFDLAMFPGEKATEDQVDVSLSFSPRPEDPPPKAYGELLKRGKSIEWFLAALTNFIAPGKTARFSVLAGVEGPPFRVPFLVDQKRQVFGDHGFRCSGIEFTRDPAVKDQVGLVSCQISEETSESSPHTLVFLSYRRWESGFEGFNPDSEQKVALDSIRQILIPSVS